MTSLHTILPNMAKWNDDMLLDSCYLLTFVKSAKRLYVLCDKYYTSGFQRMWLNKMTSRCQFHGV